jgi:hypothetical protein
VQRQRDRWRAGQVGELRERHVAQADGGYLIDDAVRSPPLSSETARSTTSCASSYTGCRSVNRRTRRSAGGAAGAQLAAEGRCRREQGDGIARFGPR